MFTFSFFSKLISKVVSELVKWLWKIEAAAFRRAYYCSYYYDCFSLQNAFAKAFDLGKKIGEGFLHSPRRRLQIDNIGKIVFWFSIIQIHFRNASSFFQQI